MTKFYFIHITKRNIIIGHATLKQSYERISLRTQICCITLDQMGPTGFFKLETFLILFDKYICNRN